MADKNGNWLPIEKDGVPYGTWVKCSFCGEEFLSVDVDGMGFCPECFNPMNEGIAVTDAQASRILKEMELDL